MDSRDLEKFRAILREQNCRITDAREEIFKLLLNQPPQSMAELQKSSGGKIDRVSLYRNIELFEKLGIVHRLYIGWKYKIELSDQFVSHHHHLTCVRCGKIVDISDEQHIDHFIHQVAENVGFTPLRHQFEIQGVCSVCKDYSEFISKSSPISAVAPKNK